MSHHSIRKILFIGTLLVTIVAIAYWRVDNYPFVNFDDDLHITDNLVVLNGLTWEGVSWAFSAIYPNWHPLTWMSHMACVELFGLNAGLHHLVNVLLHSLTTLTLFLALHHMTKTVWESAIVAALFAVHPLQVESVSWVSERKGLLCGLFWFLTLTAYSVYVAQGGRRRYFFVLMFFAMGLLSKTMIVTLPFVLMLLDYWPLGRVLPEERKGWDGTMNTGKMLSHSHLFGEKFPLVLLTLCACAFTYISQFKAGYVSNYPLGARVSNAIVSWVSYIPKLLWPRSLAVFYPHPWLDHLGIPAWKLGGSIVLLAVITIIAILWVKRRPYLAVGWFWYLGTLVPVIGLIQVGNHAMADRYAYIPSIGIFIMITWGISDLVRGWRFHRYILSSLAITYLLLLMVMTNSQISHWRSSVSLFEHAVEVVPNNWRIQVNLGQALLDEGSVKEAISKFQMMLLISPSHDEALAYKAFAINGLGMAYERQGKKDKAMKQFREAIRIYPELVVANNNMGEILSGQGRHQEAIYYFQQAVKHRPTSAMAHKNLAKSLAALGM